LALNATSRRPAGGEPCGASATLLSAALLSAALLSASSRAESPLLGADGDVVSAAPRPEHAALTVITPAASAALARAAAMAAPTDPDTLLLLMATDGSPTALRAADASGLALTPRSMAARTLDFRAQIPPPPPPARRALGEAASGSPPASPRVTAPTRPNAASLWSAPLPPRARTPQEAYALRMESKGWA
jgi:hypothetical protein